MLLDSPNVHPPLKNNQRKKANFKCKWCISLLIEHALIIWDKIAGTTASKESTRRVKSTRNNTKKQTRKINKFELLFILVMMTGSLILVLWKLIGHANPVLYDFDKFSHSLYGYVLHGTSLLLPKILQAMPEKPRPLRWVRNQFEHPNDSLQWIILLFSYMKCFLWNSKCET